MSTVEFNSMLFDVYKDVAEADLYLSASFGSSAWFALTDEVKGQALVSATRLFERTCWLGTPTGLSGQVLQWPRTGTGIAGVDDSIIPEDIGNGSSTAITVTHNLASRDLQVQVYRNAAPYDTVEVDVDRSVSTNAVLLTFASAPATNAYRVVIMPTRGN